MVRCSSRCASSSRPELLSSSRRSLSSRLIAFSAYDPRIPVVVGRQSILVTKWIGFFAETADASGNMTGRFVLIHQTGDNSCPNGGDFIVDCAVPTKPVTWGAVKASYR